MYELEKDNSWNTVDKEDYYDFALFAKAINVKGKASGNKLGDSQLVD